ncbi:hypothetical protein ASPZODRAFT_135274 [Penicilliopsis zonata CBS 506.65]|uniref:BZIP domain-containing protein n=1 Tax=Penicilliopsis zonata CBS 506.65 TaxID=1073090 RepID=A0A1L9SBF8_9EURO|nr:hypothetical protein ASPZODRAFT_135274 [Penicilliopsis zonata CBS 506.65]OJJ44449.1 hypothetical protein ASPZODRAFT_135274 [Penicilliopsis zonata CBS 506.65]
MSAGDSRIDASSLSISASNFVSSDSATIGPSPPALSTHSHTLPVDTRRATPLAPSPSLSFPSASSSTAPPAAKSSDRKRPLAPSPITEISAEKEAVIEKRQRNTMAARRCRRKKEDRLAQLEAQLKAMTAERDSLRLTVARLQGENMALRKR